MESLDFLLLLAATCVGTGAAGYSGAGACVHRRPTLVSAAPLLAAPTAADSAEQGSKRRGESDDQRRMAGRAQPGFGKRGARSRVHHSIVIMSACVHDAIDALHASNANHRAALVCMSISYVHRTQDRVKRGFPRACRSLSQASLRSLSRSVCFCHCPLASLRQQVTAVCLAHHARTALAGVLAGTQQGAAAAVAPPLASSLCALSMQSPGWRHD